MPRSKNKRPTSSIDSDDENIDQSSFVIPEKGQIDLKELSNLVNEIGSNKKKGIKGCEKIWQKHSELVKLLNWENINSHTTQHTKIRKKVIALCTAAIKVKFIQAINQLYRPEEYLIKNGKLSISRIETIFTFQSRPIINKLLSYEIDGTPVIYLYLDHHKKSGSLDKAVSTLLTARNKLLVKLVANYTIDNKSIIDWFLSQTDPHDPSKQEKNFQTFASWRVILPNKEKADWMWQVIEKSIEENKREEFINNCFSKNKLHEKEIELKNLLLNKLKPLPVIYKVEKINLNKLIQFKKSYQKTSKNHSLNFWKENKSLTKTLTWENAACMGEQQKEIEKELGELLEISIKKYHIKPVEQLFQPDKCLLGTNKEIFETIQRLLLLHSEKIISTLAVYKIKDNFAIDWYIDFPNSPEGKARAIKQVLFSRTKAAYKVLNTHLINGQSALFQYLIAFDSSPAKQLETQEERLSNFIIDIDNFTSAQDKEDIIWEVIKQSAHIIDKEKFINDMPTLSTIHARNNLRKNLLERARIYKLSQTSSTSSTSTTSSLTDQIIPITSSILLASKREDLLKIIQIKNNRYIRSNSNQRFKLVFYRGDEYFILVRTRDIDKSSKDEQWGLFPGKRYKKNQHIITFTGQKMFKGHERKVARLCKGFKKSGSNLWQAQCGSGLSVAINGESINTLAGFANDSINPNAKARYNFIHNTLDYVALRDIEPGEEITINYGSGYYSPSNPFIKRAPLHLKDLLGKKEFAALLKEIQDCVKNHPIEAHEDIIMKELPSSHEDMTEADHVYDFSSDNESDDSDDDSLSSDNEDNDSDDYYPSTDNESAYSYQYASNPLITFPTVPRKKRNQPDHVKNKVPNQPGNSTNWDYSDAKKQKS